MTRLTAAKYRFPQAFWFKALSETSIGRDGLDRHSLTAASARSPSAETLEPADPARRVAEGSKDRSVDG